MANNLFVNSGFSLWNAGTTFTGVNGARTQTADNWAWYQTSGVGGNSQPDVTIARQEFSPAQRRTLPLDFCQYFVRASIYETVSGLGPGACAYLSQRIDWNGRDTLGAGTSGLLSFYVASQVPRQIGIQVIRNWGTGSNSPSPDITILQDTFQVVGGPGEISRYAGRMTLPDPEFYTIGDTDAGYLEIRILLQDSGALSSREVPWRGQYVDIMAAQFERTALEYPAAYTQTGPNAIRGGLEILSGGLWLPGEPEWPGQAVTKAYVDGLVSGGESLPYVPLSGGTMTGFLNLWKAPESDNHAATRKYVEDRVAAETLTWTGTLESALSEYMSLGGGTMTGLLTLSGAPTTNLHAATKKYVDDSATATLGSVSTSLTSYLLKSGGTMTGALVLSGAPTVDLNPATKKYVDDGLAGKQASLFGTGFVKASGGTITYDNSTYLTSYTETDPVFSAWNKSTGITITKSQISDLDLSTYLEKSGGTMTGDLSLYSERWQQEALATSGTIAVDFAAPAAKRIVLSGDVSLNTASSNKLASGNASVRRARVEFIGNGTAKISAINPSWRLMGENPGFPIVLANGAQGNLLLECDGANETDVAAWWVPPIYAANTVAFDGVATRLQRTDDLIGNTDGTELTVSLWYRRNQLGTPAETLISFGISRTAVRWGTSGVDFLLFDTTATQVAAGSGGSLLNYDWHHVIFSVKSSGTRSCVMYVDDAPILGTTIPAADVTLYRTMGSGAINIGWNGTSQYFRGQLAELWVSNNWYDLTDPVVRRKFNSGGRVLRPVQPPSGAILYLKSPYSSFGTNSGSGGDFTVYGSLAAGAAI